MSTSTSIFKFVTLRSPKAFNVENSNCKISPSTPFVKDLISINESNQAKEEKIKSINDFLQKFIDSTDFIKDKEQLEESNNVNNWYDNIVVRVLTNSNTHAVYKLLIEKLKKSHAEKHEITDEDCKNIRVVFPEKLIFIFSSDKKAEESALPETESIKQLNDKIRKLEKLRMSAAKAIQKGVISFEPNDRMIVQDNTFSKVLQELKTDSITVVEAENEIQKSIAKVEQEIAKGNEETVDKAMQLVELQSTIINAKSRGETTFNIASFSKFSAIASEISTASDNIQEVEMQVNAQIQPLLESQAFIETAKARLNHLNEINTQITLAKTKNILSFGYISTVENRDFKDIGTYVLENRTELVDIDQLIISELEDLYEKFYGLVPSQTYTYIGESWVDTSKFEGTFHVDRNTDEISIVVITDGCHLKFPLQIADLRTVEYQTVGYLPGEIAHINNTQPGEKNTKVTRRLKKIDSYESLVNEQEVFKETDTQSTEKFSVEKTASQIQSEEESVNVNASVSAKYGPVKASVDAGYSNTNSTTNSNSYANSYAKEVVQRVVDRVSNIVRNERSSRTIEEFEETVTHVIDNTGFDSPKSYVYRWLNKLTRATLKNYGKRLIFNIDIAHPANYYLSRSIQDQPKLNIPPNPRTLEINGVRMFSVERITRENYLLWADLYNVNLEMPEEQFKIISKGFANKGEVRKTEEIEIPKGYEAVDGKFNGSTWGGNIAMMIGSSAIGVHYWNTPDNFFKWINGGNGANEFKFSEILNFGTKARLTDKIPISFFAGDFTVNFEIRCELSNDSFKKWQIKCYQAIIEGYENLKAEAEAQMTEWNPNLPGLHPLKKSALIKTELKKEALKRMFRCTPFWISDDYKVGNEYQANCCKDSLNAEKVRFLETVFDWENMTWELYPYYYADKDNWAKLLNLSDDDPMFEAFLQSSFATVRIPVHRDTHKEVAALNFMMNNSIANYETLPESMEELLEDLSDEEITNFEYDIKGNPLPAPKEEIEIGIFQLPTDLVILECGTENGIKPRPFPQSTKEPTSDVAIPQQFSPAIVSDECSKKPVTLSVNSSNLD